METIKKIHLYDGDEEALHDTEKQLEPFSEKVDFSFEKKNFFRINPDKLEDPELFDLSFNMGLLDYAQSGIHYDRFIKLIANTTKPDGLASIGVFRDDYPDQLVMEMFLNWGLVGAKNTEEIRGKAEELTERETAKTNMGIKGKIHPEGTQGIVMIGGGIPEQFKKKS